MRYSGRLLAAILAAASVLCLAAPAEAGFMLRMRQGGGAWHNFSETSPGVISLNNVNIDGVMITFSLATTNSPGGQQGIVTIANGQIRNTAGLSRALEVQVSANGFNSPLPPLTIVSSASGTMTRGRMDASFTSYTDGSNTLFGTGFSTDSLNFSAEAGTPSASFSGTVLEDGFSTGLPYSITNIGIYQLDEFAEVSLTGGNTIITSTMPEPGSITLLGMGALCLGALAWRQRRLRRRAESGSQSN